MRAVLRDYLRTRGDLAVVGTASNVRPFFFFVEARIILGTLFVFSS